MNWNLILLVGGVMGAVFLLKRISFISLKAARQHLQQGTLVVDVRNRGEYNSGHLPTAINIPLDEIETALPRQVKDKSRVLLLHCLSGTRSGMAKRQLKGMGYPNVFNLGSYGRAKQIVHGVRGS